MYNEILKIAKNIIAKNQSKKLLQYLIDDKYKDNNPSQNEINTLKTKINEIQKQSFNFPWFTHRFIQEHKHFQDIDPLLKVQKAYKKLNKELRTFKFEDNKSFSDFNEFMESYLNKNVKNQEFNAPTYCKLIHSDGKYNYYYADANDEKCYEDLHECNTKADGQQYAMWCVVNGTVTWGNYTTSQFPFYVYVTYKNNIPVMLFNFGYGWNAQIKDIHDDPFTKYDQELLNSIKQLAKKYNFDIAENEADFKTFNQIDELYNKQLDELNIDKNIISESQKYNGLNFVQQDIIYDFKKNKKAYLIANYNLINLSNYKIDINVLSLLKDSRKYDCIQSLAEIKFIEHCSEAVLKFIIDFFVQRKKYDWLYTSIKYDEIKDEKTINYIIQLFIQNKRHRQPYELIYYNKIKDEKTINQIIQCFIQNKQYNYLHNLIYQDKIKDEKIINQIIRVFINGKEYEKLYDLFDWDKIKDEKIINQIAQCFIQNKEYCWLFQLIKYDKIKNKKIINQIIQSFIQNEQYYLLRTLIGYNKIKDEKVINQIIKLFIQNKQYNRLIYLIDKDKIKDENLMKQSIQVLINEKAYDYLYELIKENKINQSLLTQEQKELLKKENPNLKLSKKLINIANILKG